MMPVAVLLICRNVNSCSPPRTSLKVRVTYGICPAVAPQFQRDLLFS